MTSEVTQASGEAGFDIYMNLSAAFGPLLREAFPDSDPLLRHVVADSLADKVRERESWFVQPSEESEAQIDNSWSGRLARANSTIEAFETALGFRVDGPCPICSGIEGCSHSIGERIHRLTAQSGEGEREAAYEELRRFARNIFNGLDTNMIRMETPADETLANVLQRGRAALRATDDAGAA